VTSDLAGLALNGNGAEEGGKHEEERKRRRRERRREKRRKERREERRRKRKRRVRARRREWRRRKRGGDILDRALAIPAPSAAPGGPLCSPRCVSRGSQCLLPGAPGSPRGRQGSGTAFVSKAQRRRMKKGGPGREGQGRA